MDTVVRALGLAPKFVLVSQMLLVFSMGPELDAEGPRGQWTILNLTASESESEVTQSCPTLSDPMDCSLRGSSIHGIFQAIVLEWIAISFSKVKVAQSCPALCNLMDYTVHGIP